MTSLEVWCAEASADAGEDLAGTAPEVRVWVALEHRGSWASKPLMSAGLPEAARACLAGWETSVPGSRIQLLRRPGRTSDGLALVVARSDVDRPWAVELELPSPEALAVVDLPRLVADGTTPGARPLPLPLVLICTHGKRDRCCAKAGIPLHAAFDRFARHEAWQTTHTGGHRFAPNVVCLPDGVVYGRVGPDEASRLWESLRRREIYDLERVRGRSAYPPAAQAADVALRRRVGLRGLDDLRLAAFDETGPEAWDVRFTERDGREHALRVTAETLHAAAPRSCGDAPSALRRFRVD